MHKDIGVDLEGGAKGSEYNQNNVWHLQRINKILFKNEL